jgi:mannosyltransferase
VWSALAFATIAAAALSLPFLAHQSLWLDEVYTRDILGAHTLGGIWRHVRATESTPPLYYLLAKLSTDLAGTRSAAAMRLPSALALIAAVPVTFLALRRMIGNGGALAAAAIVAVNPSLVAFATDARSYALFVLTGLLSVWGLSAVMERPSPPRYAAWAAASVACVWTHYFGAFLIAGEVLILLAVLGKARRVTFAWCLAIAVAAAPLIPLLARQNATEESAFIAGIPLGSRLESTVRQFGMGPIVPRTWLEAAGLALALLGAVVGAAIAVRRREARRLLVLALLAFGVPPAMAVLGFEDRVYARNLVAVLPLGAGLAALGLLRARAAPLAVYLALCAMTSVWVASNWRYEELDWRTAIARIDSVDPAAAVLATDSRNAPVIRTYLGRGPVGSARAGAVWVAVEPARGPHQRALEPRPVPGAVVAALSGFRPIREVDVHGFRLILERARAPETIVAPPGAVLFPTAPRSRP